MMLKKALYLMQILVITLILASTANTVTTQAASVLRDGSTVDAVNIRNLLQEQIDLGPRVPGSQASLDFQTWLFGTIDTNVWKVTTQSFDHNGIELNNYWITGASATHYPNYIIGAHYDSRAVADKEPSILPVPGANDGASGVAGILELMNHITTDLIPYFGFVLFDGEDQGSNGMRDVNNNSWQWIVGSQYFVDQMTADQIDGTRAFVLYDMIADDDFRLPFEPNSDKTLISQIWDQAEILGYGDIFVDERGTSLIDDHVPFKNVGIPSIDIIDFTYPEHHTTLDDMDHISEISVAIVVDVTIEWIKNIVAEEILTQEKCISISCTETSISDEENTASNSKFSFLSSLLILPPLIIMTRYLIKQKY